MIPIKTKAEEMLFLKYYKWMHFDDVIPEVVVKDYLNDLKAFKNGKRI